MEGLFSTTADLSEKVADQLQQTFVGRTLSAIDRAVKVTGDMGTRSVASGTLENRGYRAQGFNQKHMVEVGLSLEMKEVRYCTYKATATPFLNEMRNITVRQRDDRTPGAGLVIGGGLRRVRIVVPEFIRSPEEVKLYHSWMDAPEPEPPAARRWPEEPQVRYRDGEPPLATLGRSLSSAGPLSFRPWVGMAAANPFAMDPAELAPEDVPWNPSDHVNRDCVSREAAIAQARCSDWAGQKTEEARYYGQTFYDKLPSSESVANQARKFTQPFLSCMGAHDLTACDVVLNEWTIAKCALIIDKQFGKAIHPPSHYIQQAMAAIAGAVAKSESKKVSPQSERYLRLGSCAIEEQYQASVKLLMCAMCLNKLQESTRAVSHWDYIDEDYVAKVKSAEDKQLSWFPPAEDKSAAMEQLEKSVQHLIDLTGDSENVIPVLPAREMTGTPYEAITVTQSDEQREALQKAVLDREGEPPMKAMHCGPNITGAPCAIDTGAVESWMSSYTRHYCIVERNVSLPGGGHLEVRVDKSHMKPKELSKAETKCWCDMTAIDKQLFKNWLQCVHTYSAIPDVKPHSMDQEVFEALKSDVLWDTEWGFKTLVRTAVFNKSKELPSKATARARQISMPGASCDEAKYHQAIAGPFIAMIEKFHLEVFNFRNFKGATFSGRGLRVARHVSATGVCTVTIGFDKAANDRTWTWAKWCKFEEYCCQLAEVICECYFEEKYPGMLPAGVDSAKRMEWRGALLTVTADIVYYFLQSGLNPTGLANRKGVDCSVGAAILKGYGPVEYKKWLRWCSGVDCIIPEDMQIEALFPFVADGIPVKENPSTGCFTHCNEGDDTRVEIPCREIKKGEFESYSDAVDFFTTTICHVTNEIWEPAFVSKEHLNRHGGPRSIVEVMSFITTAEIVEGVLKFVQVPKPLKKLDKMAWTISQWFTIKDGPIGKLGVKDAVYHRESATRCFSMALELRHCMFVRWIVLNTGRHHLYELRKVSNTNNPDGFKPLYNDGSMEARGLADALGYLGESLNEAHERIRRRYLETDCTTDHVMSCNANAWAFDDPELVKKGNGSWLRQSLLNLDETAREIEVTEEHIVNPVSYLNLFDLGALDRTFAQVAKRLGESQKSEWDSSVPIDRVRRAVIQSVKYSGTSAASAQSQPRAAKASSRKPTEGALGGSDKGRTGNTVSIAGEPKPGASYEGPYDAGARSWSNTPNRPLFHRSDQSFVPAWDPPPSSEVGNGAGLDIHVDLGYLTPVRNEGACGPALP